MAEVSASLQRIASNGWTTQEPCYLTLLTVLGKIVDRPTEAKFRRLKTSNATLRAKIFDVPGAKEFLLASGFTEVDGGEALEFSSDTASLASARALLKKHADDQNMNELRKQRDARIASEKEKEKKNSLPCSKRLGSTEDAKEAIRQQLERDRLEKAADDAMRGPNQSSRPSEGSACLSQQREIVPESSQSQPCSKRLGSTEDAKEANRQQLERERLEKAADDAMRGPNQSSRPSEGSACLSQQSEIVPESFQSQANSQEDALPNVVAAAPGDPLRALSVHFLSGEFLDEINEAGLSPDLTIRDIEPGLVRAKGSHASCPRDKRLGAAYVDVVNGEDNVSRATHMLSYTWSYKVSLVVESLEAWCVSRKLDPKRQYIWMCVFCINQHRVIEAMNAGKMVPFESFREEFEGRVRGIGRVLALMGSWRNALYTKRVWCVFELYTAKKLMDKGSDFALEILLAPSEANEFRRMLFWVPSAAGAEVESSDVFQLDVIWRALSAIKVEEAEAFSNSDKDRILTLVKEGPGYAKLNKEIVNHLHRWFAENSEKYVSELLAKRDKDLATAYACGRVGSMLEKTSKFERALEVLVEGKAIYERHGALQSHDGAFILRILGNVLRRLDLLAEARKCYNSARTIHINIGDNTHNEYATLLSELGKLEGDCSNLASEMRLHKEAMEIRCSNGTLETPEGACLLRSLGMVHYQKNDHQLALKFFEQAKELHIKTNTLVSPEGAATLESIGNVLSSMYPRQTEKALEAQKQAFRISQELGIEESPKGMAQVRRLAFLYKLLGEKDQASRLQALANTIASKLTPAEMAAAEAGIVSDTFAKIDGSTDCLPNAVEDGLCPLDKAMIDVNWGVYFEVVDDPPFKTEAPFPDSLCSFHTKPTDAIKPRHLEVDWGSHETLDTTGRSWTLDKQSLNASPCLGQMMKFVDSSVLNGYMSPLHAVNLPDEARERLNIPSAAKQFVFSYPVEFKPSTDVSGLDSSGNTDIAFLLNGGYVYLDEGMNIIHLNALLPALGGDGGLCFGPPLTWEAKWTDRMSRAARFRPVTIDAISSGGATHFSWIRPNEIVWDGVDGGGAPICPFGGFAYIRRQEVEGEGQTRPDVDADEKGGGNVSTLTSRETQACGQPASFLRRRRPPL